MLTKEGELAAAINLLQAARNSLGDTASQRLNKSTRLDSRKTIIHRLRFPLRFRILIIMIRTEDEMNRSLGECQSLTRF